MSEQKMEVGSKVEIVGPDISGYKVLLGKKAVIEKRSEIIGDIWWADDGMAGSWFKPSSLRLIPSPPSAVGAEGEKCRYRGDPDHDFRCPDCFPPTPPQPGDKPITSLHALDAEGRIVASERFDDLLKAIEWADGRRKSGLTIKIDAANTTIGMKPIKPGERVLVEMEYVAALAGDKESAIVRWPDGKRLEWRVPLSSIRRLAEREKR